MDPAVLKALAKWPEVPDVYGWLQLDRRGDWRIKGEKIGNAALRAFICRNYAADPSGCWYFQNGPQKVFVQLAYTPLVVHYEGERLLDHCGQHFAFGKAHLDEEGSVLIEGGRGIALLDDRDLARFAESNPGALDGLPRLARISLPGRFGYVADPRPGG